MARPIRIKHPYLAVLLAILWMVLQNSFTYVDFILGLVAALVVLWVLPPPAIRWQRLRLRRPDRILYMAGYFLKEVVMSNIFVARLVLRRRPALYPGIIAFPLQVRGNTQITVVANMITLTPGTLSVEVAPDRSCIYVHCIDARDAEGVLASAREFERLVQEVTE